jgi:RHS repeat-associated protein
MGAFDDDLADININNNYGYTEIGELKFDKQEEISEIEWMVNGKVKAIYRPDTSSKKELKFDYDPMGQRIAKHIYSSSGVWEKSTYYVRDAGGNVMSVYEHSVIDSTSTINYLLQEQHLYGSSRLGMRADSLEMIGAAVDTVNWNRPLGNKKYELSNHLGNVLSVVSDVIFPMDDDSDGDVDRYLADILTATDYSPFGVVLEERDFSSEEYKYGLQNQERDDEIKGEGNSINFEYRMYDPRLGRFLSIDPFASKYVEIAPYAFCANSPIGLLDPDGRGIMAANDAAEELIEAMIEYFGDPRSVANLFGLDRVERGVGIEGYYTSHKSVKQFNKDLKAYAKEKKWSKEKIKYAKSFHRALRSVDVIEIGLIYPRTGAKIDGEGKSQGTSNKHLFTENQKLTGLLVDNSKGDFDVEKLKAALKENDGGDLPGGGAYGFFRDANYSPTADSEPRTEDKLRGLLLVNAPKPEGSFTYGDLINAGSRMQVAEKALQAVDKVAEKLQQPAID